MVTPVAYRERRARLSKDIGSGLVLFLGNDEVGMNYAANIYPFRQDSTVLYCDKACQDYYVVRAVENVTSKIWTAVLAQKKADPKTNIVTYKNRTESCISGTWTANGTAGVEKDGSVSIDIDIDFDQCLQTEPNDGGGYDATMDGVVSWNGAFSANGIQRTFTYLITLRNRVP